MILYKYKQQKKVEDLKVFVQINACDDCSVKCSAVYN